MLLCAQFRRLPRCSPRQSSLGPAEGHSISVLCGAPRWQSFRSSGLPPRLTSCEERDLSLLLACVSSRKRRHRSHSNRTGGLSRTGAGRRRGSVTAGGARGAWRGYAQCQSRRLRPCPSCSFHEHPVCFGNEEVVEYR